MRQLKSEWEVSELQVSYTQPKPVIKFSDSGTVELYLRHIWDKDLMSLQEQFYCLFLNQSNNLICWRCISLGTTTACLVDVKLLVTIALKCNAENIVIAHNHPGGNVAPSEADKNCTNEIIEACRYFNIGLLDHIILSKYNCFSFVDNGLVDIDRVQKKKYLLKGSPKKLCR